MTSISVAFMPSLSPWSNLGYHHDAADRRATANDCIITPIGHSGQFRSCSCSESPVWRAAPQQAKAMDKRPVWAGCVFWDVRQPRYHKPLSYRTISTVHKQATAMSGRGLQRSLRRSPDGQNRPSANLRSKSDGQRPDGLRKAAISFASPYGGVTAWTSANFANAR